MSRTIGRVINGQIVVIDDPQLLAELDAAMEEAERGEGEPWEVVRQKIFGDH